ncbi:hypothetical protein JL721_1648 [Aureococcus anophagefferens]|nr:hypothetical protein JL721_1648 [Aureococcus anophagefferens]
MAAAKRSTVMAAVKRSTVVVLLLAAASAEPLKSLGDTLTDEAIGLAGQGRMQEALERFFDAREAEPQDSRRWQNALSQHEAHRDRERGQPPPPPARSAAPKPPPTIFPGGATKKELLARAEAYFDELDDVDDWLGAWWRDPAARRTQTAALRDQLARHGGLAQIRGFLADDVAATLSGEMAASEQWSPVQGFSRFYQFHFLMLDSNADNYWKANATVLHAMHGLFNSRHLKAWAAGCEKGEAEAGNETATAVAAAVAAAGAVAATTIGDPLLDGAALTAAGAGSADVGAALTGAGAGGGVVASFAAATTTAADVVTGATAAAPALAEATAPALADGVASAAATAARRPPPVIVGASQTVAKGFAASGGAETATKVAKGVAASGGAETVSRVVKGVAASGVADSSAVKVGAGVEALSGGAGADALAKVGAGVEALSESGTMVLSKLAPLAEPALGAAEGAGLAAGLAAAVVGTAEVLKQNPAPVIATGALLGLARWAATELTGEVTTADDPLKKGEKTRVLKMLAIDAKPEKKG